MRPHTCHIALSLLLTVAGCADNGTTNGTTGATDAAIDMVLDAPIAPEAGADVGVDTADISDDVVDARSEKTDSSPTDGGFDARDADVGDADARDNEAGDDGAADGDADRSEDGLDVAPDRLTCQLPAVVAYNMPGCGANAPPPYCQGPTDACLSFVCGCDGVTAGSGCGYATAPFAAWGRCADGGSDASSD